VLIGVIGIKSHKSFLSNATVSRTLNLDDWLRTHLPGEAFSFAPASEDAASDAISASRPQTHAHCDGCAARARGLRPFVKVARCSAGGVNVPRVLAEDSRTLPAAD